MGNLSAKITEFKGPEKRYLGSMARNIAGNVITSAPQILSMIFGTMSCTGSIKEAQETPTEEVSDENADLSENSDKINITEQRNHLVEILKRNANITTDPNSELINSLLRKQAAYRTIYPNKTADEIDIELCKFARAYEAKKSRKESELTGTSFAQKINATMEHISNDEELNQYISEHYQDESKQEAALNNATRNKLKEAFNSSTIGAKYYNTLTDEEYDDVVKTTFKGLGQEYTQLLDDNGNNLLEKIEFIKQELQNKYISLGDKELEALYKADTMIRALEEGDLDRLYEKIAQAANDTSVTFTDDETLLLSIIAKWDIIDTDQNGSADNTEISSYLLAMSKSADSKDSKDYIIDAADYYQFDVDIENNAQQVQTNISNNRRFLEK